MSKDLELVVSKEFEGVTLDCYVEPEQTDKSNFWATRTQIGQLLGYENPRDAIKDIHERHRERLDKFSTQRKLRLHEENRVVTREVIMYDFKGLLEICRYSQQPNANAVIDVLWDIADEIRRTGSYSKKPRINSEELEISRRDLDIRGAQILQSLLDNNTFPCTPETKTVFSHEIFKLVTGHECLTMLPESTEKWYRAGEIGEILGISANKVGRIAKEYGIQPEQGTSNKYGRWIFSKSRNSNHECSTCIYNSLALEWFKDFAGM